MSVLNPTIPTPGLARRPGLGGRVARLVVGIESRIAKAQASEY